MRGWTGISRGLILASLAGLVGCGDILVEPPAQTAAPPVAPPPAEPLVKAPSQASRDLARYYSGLQNSLLTQGLLRGDGGGPDTPFTDTQLARNFVQIALFNEYRDDSDFSRPQATVSKLRRWDQPIRMHVQFGDTVPLAQRDQDQASVSAYAARLSRLTGVPVTQTDRRPNFHVLFLGEDDRRAYADELRNLIPGISDATVRAFTDLPRNQLCVVIGSFKPGQSSYRTAIALIRAEHPNLMRSACIHEELAQGMGLANDSPAARPSIFNDDEEFALLTTHDELLLQMLYDPRFETGMPITAAAPIARQVATEIVTPGQS
ncbi:DUF2927 domain-containing protein [Yoonia sediminilitoris]|uniref:DUF2927 family protein n=1 Tax=Yoonia sediminilitoris TaxID=1286148 RepID=A0A2T6KQ04_9RHOB|nr:DUF2927 domain-containing protein [Yoonia sediminilitoris]PUB18628.1 Protein of unknown function (DUF2927) [Yoonia sediminilitoris]RCW98796.1 DUF2927 family protein [Yoonia sediminilitoris]